MYLGAATRLVKSHRCQSGAVVVATALWSKARRSSWTSTDFLDRAFGAFPKAPASRRSGCRARWLAGGRGDGKAPGGFLALLPALKYSCCCSSREMLLH